MHIYKQLFLLKIIIVFICFSFFNIIYCSDIISSDTKTLLNEFERLKQTLTDKFIEIYKNDKIIKNFINETKTKIEELKELIKNNNPNNENYLNIKTEIENKYKTLNNSIEIFNTIISKNKNNQNQINKQYQDYLEKNILQQIGSLNNIISRDGG
jgi:hypothetical protein